MRSVLLVNEYRKSKRGCARLRYDTFMCKTGGPTLTITQLDGRRELEQTIATLTKQRDALQIDIASLQQSHAKVVREHESEREKWQQQRLSYQDDIVSLKARQGDIESTLASQRSSVERAKKENASLVTEIQQLRDSLQKERAEVARVNGELTRVSGDLAIKDRRIAQVSSELDRKEAELRAEREDGMLQMREMQLSITQVMNQRAARKAI
ncbi:hypothetical protein DFS34DRAFT_295003 [Phlyctochytrium arcticum]|nr:hypothetical protein DFS34DRAFT_295003 [Phlyctochytrium arcticum]